MKNLDVIHFNQLDNRFNPHGSCNVTSMAMCLYYHGIRGDKSQAQLEDQIYQRFIDMRLSRHNPDDIKTVLESYPKIVDTLNYRGSPSDIKRSIDEGCPVIVHGYFTRFGHIIVVRGYDNKGFFVNDPYGEVYITETHSSLYYPDKGLSKGKNKHYSYSLMSRACSPESYQAPNHYWMHTVRRV